MFIILSLLLETTNSLDLDSILLVYGPETPFSYFYYFENFNTSLNISASTELSDFFQYSDIKMIVDISCDQNLFYLLDQICELLNIFYLTSTTEKQRSFSRFRFYLTPSLKTKSQAISDLISVLGWDEITVLSHTDPENIEIASQVKSLNKKQINIEFYGNIALRGFLELIRLRVRSEYVRTLVIIENSLIRMRWLAYALIINEFPKYGEYILFITENSDIVKKNGALIFAEAYATESLFPSNRTYNSVLAVIQQLHLFTYNEMKTICPDFQCNHFFEIINVKDSKSELVAKWDKKIEKLSQFEFPGNNKNQDFLPELTEEFIISKIQGSLKNSVSLSLNEDLWFKGAEYALNKSNFLKDVPKASLKFNLLNCVKNETNWIDDCISIHEDSFGDAFITNFWMTDVMETYEAFNNKSMKLVQVSPFSIYSATNEDVYNHNLVLPGLEIGEMIRNLLLLFITFEWRSFILFTTDSPFDMMVYSKYLEIIKSMNLNIENPEHLRIFPANYTRNDFEQFKDFFEYAKKSQCRIFHLLSASNADIIEGLYDIGIKQGDAIIMGSLQLYKFLLEDIEEKYLKKRKAMLRSALLSTIAEFQGVFGKNLKQELELMYQDVKFMCLTFDSISILKNALTYIQLNGFQTSQLFLTISKLRVLGCSGSIYFLGSTNYRIGTGVEIDQLVFNEKTRSVKPQSFVMLDRFSTTNINILQEPIWYSSGKTPTNYLDFGNCGFDTRDSVSSSKGRLNLMIVSLLSALICVVSSYFSLKFYNYSIIPEDKKLPGSISDILFLLFFPCELAQILSLEPTQGIVFKILKQSIFLFSCDFFQYLDIKFDLFWQIYSFLLSYAFLFSISCIFFSVYWKHLDESASRVHKVLIFIIEHGVPPVVNILFMPTVSMILNIFDCTEATGDRLTQTYLNRDCTQNCFSGKHLIFSVIAGLVLAFYIATCTYLRIFWELVQYSLHFCTSPIYLASLNIFQVVLVLVYKNLNYSDPGLSGFVISGLVFCFALWTFRLKPYNYSRINVIQMIILVFAGVIVFLSSFYVQYNESVYVYFVYFPVTCLTLLALMVWYKKSPAFFIADKIEDIPKLIVFQFRTSIDSINNSSR